jgi:hypothetical protein
VDLPREVPPEGPPADPEDWTDEQWIEWLNKTDATADGADIADVTQEGPATQPVTALGRVAYSSGGSVLGHAMLGVANVLYGHDGNKVVIVAEGIPEPDEDKAFDVHLDPEHPERSVVVFRTPRAQDPGGG